MSAVRATSGGRITVIVGRAAGLGTPPGLSWSHDPESVIDTVDGLRRAHAPTMPSAFHEALARLQQAMSPRRCTVLSQGIDGLLLKAAAADVLEMEGSLWRLRCAADPTHPRTGIFGAQNRVRRCGVCGGPMRPDVRLDDEPLDHLDDAREAVRTSRVLLCVEVDPHDPSVRSLLALAREHGVRRWQVHPHADPEPFDESLRRPADHGVPQLVGRWLHEAA